MTDQTLAYHGGQPYKIGELVLSVFFFFLFAFFLKFLAVYKSNSLARTGTQLA